MGLTFEWNSKKAATNLRKHGVSLEEAASAFADPVSVTISDPEHSKVEDRYILLGRTYGDRIVVVVHPERGDSMRIISGREATGVERRAYGGE